MYSGPSFLKGSLPLPDPGSFPQGAQAWGQRGGCRAGCPCWPRQAATSEHPFLPDPPHCQVALVASPCLVGPMALPTWGPHSAEGQRLLLFVTAVYVVPTVIPAPEAPIAVT